MSVKPMSVKPMSVEIAAFSDRHDQIRCSRSGVCIGLALFLGAVSMSALSAEIWATEKNGSVATGSFWDEGVLPGDSDEGTLKNSIGTLGAGESFSGQNFTVGREGTATNAVSGGTMTLSGELAVGTWGSGWMEVSDGSVSVRKLNLGLFGSVGYMDVSGGTVSVSGDNFCVGGYGGGYGYGYGNNYGYGYGSQGKKYGSRGYGSRQTQSSDGSETPNHPDADNSPRPEREERRSA